jgi:heptosyltransferase II
MVRAPNWLGDAVMALPAIAAIRRTFSDAALIVAARHNVMPLFREITSAAPDELIIVDEAREIQQLREARAETIVLLPNSFHSAWIARRAGIASRWGYAAAGRSLLLTRAARRSKGVIHQVEYYLALAAAFGADTTERVPSLRAREETLARADALLRESGVTPGERLVGFAPGAAYGRAKRWPPRRTSEVAARLSAQGYVPVLLGAAADRRTGREIESALPPHSRLVNLIGKTDLRLLIGITARCAAFVSNDSGAMHVAAALGVPLTAIFGPTNERETAPAGPGPRTVIRRQVFCSPCMLRECPIDHRCMKRIRVDDVLGAVQAHLGMNEA